MCCEFRNGARRISFEAAQDGVSRIVSAAQKRAVISRRARGGDTFSLTDAFGERTPVRHQLRVATHERDVRRTFQDFVAYLVAEAV